MATVGAGSASPLYIDPAVPYAEMPSRQRKKYLNCIWIVFVRFKTFFVGLLKTDTEALLTRERNL